MGWGTYFAFLLAGVNTLTVTYYLAIENLPFLKEIFPSFQSYIIIITIIAIPTLITIGWLHFRRTAAYGSEAEITIESNPYYYKVPPGYHREVIFPLYLEMIQFIIRTSKNEKLAEDDLSKITELQKKVEVLMKGGQIGSPRNPFDKTIS